jgi:hypothetical protein
MGLAAGSKVIDVGCGIGGVAFPMAEVTGASGLVTTPYEFFVHATSGTLTHAVEVGDITRTELDEWLGEQAALNVKGVFSMHGYLYASPGHAEAASWLSDQS